MYGLLTARAVAWNWGIWNYNALKSCIRALANVSNPGMRRSIHEQSRGINDSSRQWGYQVGQKAAFGADLFTILQPGLCETTRLNALLLFWIFTISFDVLRQAVARRACMAEVNQPPCEYIGFAFTWEPLQK